MRPEARSLGLGQLEGVIGGRILVDQLPIAREDLVRKLVANLVAVDRVDLAGGSRPVVQRLVAADSEVDLDRAGRWRHVGGRRVGVGGRERGPATLDEQCRALVRHEWRDDREAGPATRVAPEDLVLGVVGPVIATVRYSIPAVRTPAADRTSPVGHGAAGRGPSSTVALRPAVLVTVPLPPAQ